MNLNAWLYEHGYLALKKGISESGDWFQDVDWFRTRAYTMGLNGLYMNIKGREREGTVEAGAEAEALKEELRGSSTGWSIPLRQSRNHRHFRLRRRLRRPHVDDAPDLIVGYGEGFRASWDSVLGKLTTAFSTTISRPGAAITASSTAGSAPAFANRNIAIEKPAIVDVAPTVMKLFGLELPTYFDGKPWAVESGRREITFQN